MTDLKQADYDFGVVTQTGQLTDAELEAAGQWQDILRGDDVDPIDGKLVDAIFDVAAGLHRPKLLDRFRGYVLALDDSEATRDVLVIWQIEADLGAFIDDDEMAALLDAVVGGQPDDTVIENALAKMRGAVAAVQHRPYWRKRVGNLVTAIEAGMAITAITATATPKKPEVPTPKNDATVLNFTATGTVTTYGDDAGKGTSKAAPVKPAPVKSDPDLGQAYTD